MLPTAQWPPQDAIAREIQTLRDIAARGNNHRYIERLIGSLVFDDEARAIIAKAISNYVVTGSTRG
jgi:hypothetical protein